MDAIFIWIGLTRCSKQMLHKETIVNLNVKVTPKILFLRQSEIVDQD
jgi:hypothetical protein